MKFLSLRNRSLIPGIVLASVFFAVGLFINNDFGQTIDEPNVMGAGRYNVSVIASVFRNPFPLTWPFHDLRGYYFIVDTIRASIAETILFFHPAMGFIRAFHVGNLLFSCAAIFVLYALTLSLTKDVLPSFAAALTLATHPQFIAHSQNNAVDLVSLFVFSLTVYLLLRAARNPAITNCAAAVLSLGWALTTRPMSLLIIINLCAWFLIIDFQASFKRIKIVVLSFIASIPVCFLMWPYLWTDTVDRVFTSINHLRDLQFDINEAYLGTVSRVSALPWHYASLHFFVSTPTVIVVFFCISFCIFLRNGRSRPELADAQRLGIVWFFSGLIFSIHSPLCYNAWRHFLFILPGFCLMVGVAAAVLWRVLGPRISSALILLSYGFVLARDVAYHPYEGAYLNEVANFFIPADAERYFSLEYFGQAYLEGARWINDHAEKDAVVMVPIFKNVANTVLTTNPAEWGSLNEYLQTKKPCYVMYITRVSRFNNPLIVYLEKNERPIFTIRRGKGTLLKIYKKNGQR
jgi:hypothetical protein